MIPLYDANPTRITPFITIAIVLANLIAFGLQVSGDNFSRQLFQYGAIPKEILNSVDIFPYTSLPVHANLFTSMFMHGGFLHLAGNLLFLWIFGNNVEDLMGHFRFLVFYLLCGVCAVMTHILQFQNSVVPMVGASGAIAGLLAGYLLAFPRAKIYTLFWFIIFIRIIAVPAWFIIGIWFLLQISNLGSGGPVAWSAHIGGFVAGLMLIPFFSRRKLFRWSRY